MIHEIDFKDIPKVSTAKKLDQLESKMLEFPQVPCPVTHSFGPGVYLREVHLPRNSVVTGHHHNFEHMNIFLKGKITFFGDNGPVELHAPMTMMSKPGRKIAYIHEDSIWINVYATLETDVEKLEEILLTKSSVSIADKLSRQDLKLLTSKIDNDDYENLLKELELDPKVVRAISENTEDMTELPYGNYKFKVTKSKVEGDGIFATADIHPQELIAPARIKGKRTIAGRFTNHSKNPNAKMIKIGDGDIGLQAIRRIEGSKGGQDGDEITVDYREAYKLTLKIGEQKCQL